MRKWIKNHSILAPLLIAGTLYALLCLATLLPISTKATPQNIMPQPIFAGHVLSPADIDTRELWTLVNSERTNRGLSALSLNPRLNASAEAKCDDMVAQNYWSHNSPDGREPWHFMLEQGIPDIRLGENIGSGFHNAKDEVDGWMNSTEHRENILDYRFTDVGYAVCRSDKFVFGGGPMLITVQHLAQL